MKNSVQSYSIQPSLCELKQHSHDNIFISTLQLGADAHYEFFFLRNLKCRKYYRNKKSALNIIWTHTKKLQMKECHILYTYKYIYIYMYYICIYIFIYIYKLAAYFMSTVRRSAQCYCGAFISINRRRINCKYITATNSFICVMTIFRLYNIA